MSWDPNTGLPSELVPKSDLKVYIGADGQPFIKRSDHKRYCDGLLNVTKAFVQVQGGALAIHADRLMKFALERDQPRSGDPNTATKYFGANLQTVQGIIQPMVETLIDKLPGLDTWLAVTGFGNDKDFILALWALVRAVKDQRSDSAETKKVVHGLSALNPPRDYKAEIAKVTH